MNIVMQAHFKSSIYLQNSEERYLKHCYGFVFFLERHTLKAVFTYKILKEGALNTVTGFFLQKHTLRSSIYY